LLFRKSRLRFLGGFFANIILREVFRNEHLIKQVYQKIFYTLKLSPQAQLLLALGLLK